MGKEALVSKTPVLGASGSEAYRGWFDVVKAHTSQFDPRLVEAAVFGIGGFILGYLLKNFGRLAMIGLVGLVVLFAALHYLEVYSVDLVALKADLVYTR